MARPTFATVDDYLAALPAPAAARVGEVLSVLRAALPHAEERISYQIPSFKLYKRYALYCAGYAHHTGVYPVMEGVRRALGEEIAPYLTNASTLRFPHDAPLPLGLIQRVAEESAREAEAARALTASTPETA